MLDNIPGCQADFANILCGLCFVRIGMALTGAVSPAMAALVGRLQSSYGIRES